MTGQNLIDSLTTPPETTTDETPGQQALREGLSFKAGVIRLLGLFATESIDRNLKAEDEAFGRSCNGKKEGSQQSPEDDMKITAAGNVTINNPPSGSQPAPVAAQAKAGAGWLPKAVMGAAMLGGGAGVGYIVNDLLKPTPVVQGSANDTDTITEMYFP